MGEKCDNFSFAWNGMSLEWDLVLGSCFDDAPKGWVSVFRESSVEELMFIVREGLSVFHEEVRDSGILQEMEMLDRFRPKRIVDRGISRMDAISAIPSAMGGSMPLSGRRVLLEMKVDPRECFVGDMDYLNYAVPFGGGGRRADGRYRSAFRRYWDSLITLSDFLKHYTKVSMPEGDHWLKVDRAPLRLPDAFFSPEVLIMSPNVSAQHIRIAGALECGRVEG